MKRLTSTGAIGDLMARARRLDPTRGPRWGRLTADRMLCHLADVLRVSLGDCPGGRRRVLPLEMFPLKQLVIHVLPWPHGVKVPKEVFVTAPTSFDADLGTLEELMHRFVGHDPPGEWPPHPVFGAMRQRDWDRMMYRHIDHHLRQFGV